MIEELETLTKNSQWSFANGNNGFKGSNQSRSKRKAYVHYQQCVQAANLKFLKSQVVGFTVNFCCGRDPTGDVKVDVDREMLLQRKCSSLDRSDFVVADIHHAPFRDRCCDSVVADPPFSVYNKFKWALDLAKLANKKMLLSHPCTNLKVPGFSRELYFTNSKSIFLRLWWVYTRLEASF